jgi:hypothetical protein
MPHTFHREENKMDTELLVIDWSIPHVFHCDSEEIANDIKEAAERFGHKAQIIRDVS